MRPCQTRKITAFPDFLNFWYSSFPKIVNGQDLAHSHKTNFPKYPISTQRSLCRKGIGYNHIKIMASRKA